jgi:hypothetical protein
MNARLIMLLTLLASVFVCATSFASWHWIGGFQNAVNYTVPNWNYTGQVGFKSPASYLLFTVHNISIVNTQVGGLVQAEGYDKNLNDIGNVTLFPIAQVGNSITYLASYITNSGQAWNTLTIYSNPLIGTTFENQNVYGWNLGYGNRYSSVMQYKGQIVYVPDNFNLLNVTTQRQVIMAMSVQNSNIIRFNFTVNNTNIPKVNPNGLTVYNLTGILTDTCFSQTGALRACILTRHGILAQAKH